MEGIGKDVFEEWMKRLMERIDPDKQGSGGREVHGRRTAV